MYLGELHFARVEVTNAGDFVARVHDGGRLALGLGKRDVNEVTGVGHDHNRLEVVVRHLVE